MKQKSLRTYFNDQLSCWPLACNNFRTLKNVAVRELEVRGLGVRLQFNPGRIVSSAAKTDEASLKARKCFLCPSGRFAEQISRKFEGRKGKKYDILVNPYPIFPEHYVIALDHHSGQSIWRRYVDLLDLSKVYGGYTFFYNGPKCGASAPDHHHFQACPRSLMPLECDVDRLLDCLGDDMPSDGTLKYLTSVQDAELYHYRKFTKGVFVLRAATSKSAAKLFYRLLDCAPKVEGDSEPRFNLFTYYKSGQYRSIIVFRSRHRSHHYFSDGPDHLTMSPGCADMGGIFIVPDKGDYDKLDGRLLSEMVSEVSITGAEEELMLSRLTRTQPNVSVGIMSAKEIEFEIFSDGAGARKARLVEGKIEYDGALYDELFFGSQTLSTMFAEPTFMLYGVTIGKGFHWERKEDQKFAGALRIIVEDGQLTAVNVVGVEDYLLSVISSEMKATASEEFLKVHAVISRSWLMARLRAGESGRKICGPAEVYGTPALVSYLDSLHGCGGDSGEHIKWYDHEEHRHFDVCADDHCQRYQGLSRAVGDKVRNVVDATWGQVLMCDGELCDARFSKCCGGVTETFGTCWDDREYPYLQALPDTPEHEPGADVFCNTDDAEILGQVLNDYDLETGDFYEWTVEYGRDELSELICRRSGVEIGQLQALEPMERGKSGRICKLRIVGSERSLIVGKELEIRRILSESHLKSSAFDVEYIPSSDAGSFTSVVLRGHGWGHGVGLCQIGAAVMASEGYDYRRILSHYYPGTVIGVLK